MYLNFNQHIITVYFSYILIYEKISYTNFWIIEVSVVLKHVAFTNCIIGYLTAICGCI